jgi:hypothetical protein
MNLIPLIPQAANDEGNFTKSAVVVVVSVSAVIVPDVEYRILVAAIRLRSTPLTPG